MNILLIEPEEIIAERIQCELEKCRFCVTCCSCPVENAGARVDHSFEIVLVELDIQNEIGGQIIERVRKGDQGCKIMAIGNHHISRQFKMLCNGADDYIEKSRLDELKYRIHLLRQRAGTVSANLMFYHKEFEFNESQSLLTYRNRQIHLTKTERKILFELFRNGNTVEFQTLQDKVWNDYMIPDFNRLQFHISVLRKKVLKISPNPLIATIKGKGYCLT